MLTRSLSPHDVTRPQWATFNRMLIFWKILIQRHLQKHICVRFKSICKGFWLQNLNKCHGLFSSSQNKLKLLMTAFAVIWHLYNSAIFESDKLVYWPDCSAEGGCHANSEATALLAITAAQGNAGGTIVPVCCPNKITLSSLLPFDLTMYHRFHKLLQAVSLHGGINLTPTALCKSACTRTWKRSLQNNGHHVMFQFNQ